MWMLRSIVSKPPSVTLVVPVNFFILILGASELNFVKPLTSNCACGVVVPIPILPVLE